MPLADPDDQPQRQDPRFSDAEIDALLAFVATIAPGGEPIPSVDPAAGSLSEGAAVFLDNCAACHGYGLGGGALSSGKYAPSLEKSTAREIYGAVLTGPQNMPVFGDNQLTPAEKRALIGYIQALQSEKTDSGGLGMSRLGPVPEALVIFLVGMVALVFATLWIAGKS